MIPRIQQQPGESASDVTQRAMAYAQEVGRGLVFVDARPVERQTPAVDHGAEVRRMRELQAFAKSRRSLADKTLNDSLDVPAPRRAKYEARAQRYNEEAEAAEFEAAEIRRVVLGSA